MHLKITVISIFIITGFACCHSKSNRQLPFEDDRSAAALLQQYAAAAQYDSILELGSQWVNSKIEQGKHDTAIALTDSLYELLAGAKDLQKKLALAVYDKRDKIEQDSLALDRFYKLFTHKYAFDQFSESYDPEYVSIAEYFILLAQRFPFLDAGYLGEFYQDLGIIYNIAGDMKKALYYNNIIYTMDRKDMDGKDTAFGYFCSSTINTSIALNEEKQFDSVTSIVSLALSKKGITDYYEAGLCTIMADALLNKENTIGAASYISRAEQAAARLENQHILSAKLFDAYMLKSRLLARQQQFARALAVAGKALEYGLDTFGYRNRRIGKNLLQIGSCFKQLNRPDSAIWHFHQALFTVAQVDSSDINALPSEKNVYAENTIMDALDSLAMMWDEQYVQTKQAGFLKKALQARGLAFIVERKLLEAFSYDESMKSQLLSGKKRSEYALNNCWLLWQNDHDPQWIAQAILMNENSKAVALLHSVKKNTVLASMQVRDTLEVLLNRNRLYINALEKDLNRTTVQNGRTGIQNRLDSLYGEGFLLEKKLKIQLPGFKRSGIDTSLLSISSIKKQLLGKQTCLLQYFRAGSGAFLVWLDGEQAQGMKWLPENDLQKVRSFIDDCRSLHGSYETDKPAFLSLAKACTDIALPDSIQKKIKNKQYKKLLVIPDGGFSMLPFDALTPAGDQFLVQFSTVHTGYSISTLLANETTKIKGEEISVFAPFTKKNIGTLERLEFSQNEANAIAAAKKQAVIYDDTAAGINRFRLVLPTSAIIHIATHATGNDSVQQVYFSDTPLDVTELYASRTNAGLVVLNGCETGIGRLDPNEGPLSLARGFYYAGARNVINSLWQIDDLASAGIFSNFYSHYSTGHAGASLHNAKLNYLNTRSGRLKAPYYWAGLVHIGLDEQARPGKKINRWWILPAALAIIASLVLAPLAYKRRRR